MKRIISFMLVFCMVFSLVPVTVFAAGEDKRIPVEAKNNAAVIGDLNGDNEIDRADVELLAKYFAGYSNVESQINWNAADANGDGSVTRSDAMYLARYYNEWENYSLPDPDATYSVAFYDGSRLIDTLYAEKDQPLGAVPSIEKSSKANAILLGYYTDPEFSEPFYAENPVTGNMNVYAKYEEMGEPETLNFTSFAQMDQEPDLSFEISGYGNPEAAVTLEVMDGSDPVELKVERFGSSYIVYAPEGFNEGCSYQLHLADGWTFTDKPETIRTASFSIFKEQVENLRMNDDIVYVKDTDAIDYLVGGQSYDMLTSELITEQGGSFNYSDAAIDVGDIICIYTGTHPEQRGMNADTLDPAYYVVAKAVSGSTITFTALGENDFLKLYNIPDNFPIKVDALPSGTTGTVNISALDADMYAFMMGDGYTLETALDAIEVGDFISMFISQDSIETEDDLYFGEITAYNAATGEITYKKVTRQDILDSMDLYRDIEISGDDLITDEKKAEIEDTILLQVKESGFAEDAAFMLADIISKTDGFKNAGIESLLITDSDGNVLSDEEIQLLNLGASFELTDDVELKVELITEGDQLHYKNGTQLAVGVEAEFEVELEDDEKIAIEIEATFIQEVEIDPRVKGYVIPYVVFFIPIPVGVNASGTIDIKSFTAFSFEAEIFTVAPEDKEVWEQFKDIIEDPRKLAELPGMPEELSKGLNTVGDVFDKIEEIEDNMAKIKEKAEEFEETAEQYMGYAEDLEVIWNYVEANGLTTKEDWKGMCDTLDKTSITSDLLEMMDLTNETELETEYYESLEALMERYCEMVEKETDWVTLFNEDLFNSPEICIYGVTMSIDVDFVVRADLSLAIGSNMQYEVGKRYEFYFKFAPFYKNAGCNSMDLIDERFAFQFYVMGRLGLKAGVNAKFEVGIGSTTLANIGVSLELGPYMKFWGFFVYEYEKYRPANTTDWHSDERMAGSVLFEFGLYLKMAFEAEALDGAFSYEYEFLDEEFPLLTIGDEYFYYQPNYSPAEDEVILIKDKDGNSSNGITMTLPDYTLALDYVNMKEGYMAIDYVDYDKFIYTVSNPNFSIDSKTGVITVNVPDDDTRYMECDLTVTYKYGKLAFSTYDMTVTVPLVWTSLSTDELSEYYTAAVRVGNDEDGYTTVWQKRVLKNTQFDLPTADEIMDLIGWNEYKYDMGTGYGSQQTEDLTLIEDEVYDFNIYYDTYYISVANVENGYVTETRTYDALYGEMFDFSDLADTGTNAAGVYTKFSELTHSIDGLDLDKAIDSRMADILEDGVTVYANYVDNSVTATFMFTGIDAENIVMTLRRGDEPSIAQIQRIAEDAGLAIKEITPAITPITASTVYQVICGELDTEPATITFEENGGSVVADITKPYGSLIGNLPTPTKTGHTFDGWYEDEALTKAFTLVKVPANGATAYAKWTANEYTVTLHVNGGNELTNDKMTVTYGSTYGELPKPSKNGHGFIGWFTAQTGGTQVTNDTKVTLTGNQTLYAQWRELEVIPETIFDFGDYETFIYERYVGRDAEYVFTPVDGETYAQDEFKLEYIAEGYENEGYTDAPYKAGTWGVKISRPADDYYAKFEEFYTNVLLINKGQRDTSQKVTVDQVYTAYSAVGFKIQDTQFELMDIDPQATVQFKVETNSGSEYSKPVIGGSGMGVVERLSPGGNNLIYIKIMNDRNYEEAELRAIKPNDNYTSCLSPNRSGATWLDKDVYYTSYDTSWYNNESTSFVINTAEELAGLAYLVNNGNTFAGRTVTLGADIDLHPEGGSKYWIPIGTGDNPFMGIFDGAGHTIDRMVVSTDDKIPYNITYLGLFGRVYGGRIKNVKLTGSYITTTKENAYVGGIVGDAVSTIIDNCEVHATIVGKCKEEAYGVGGIAGGADSGTIISCISDGKITGKYQTGGIVGILRGSSDVVNCINYSDVNGTSGGYGTGGIVGTVEAGLVYNCVNLGDISAVSSVGGIIGLISTKNGDAYNCYTAGKVYGSATSSIYVGAVIGRNMNNKGFVSNVYYLKGSASNYKGTVKGAGTKSGSEDEAKNLNTGYFASLTSQMQGNYYTGGILIHVLNAWQDNYVKDSNYSLAKDWTAEGPDGYPIPNGN